MNNALIFFGTSLGLAAVNLLAFWAGRDVLTTLIVLQGILANLLVLKEIELFGFFVTASDVFIIGMMLGINLLHEFSGKAAAQRVINIYMLAQTFFMTLCCLHLWYQPSVHDYMHGHYQAILQQAPRIVFATLGVSYFTLCTERWLYAQLQTYFGQRYLVFRHCVTVLLTQFVDTCLFSYIALYGLFSHMTHIILISYSVKVVSCLLMAPFLKLALIIKPKSKI